MWRIFNWLFGWHYVWVLDCGDSYVRRVRLLPNGELIGSEIVLRKFFISKDGVARGAHRIQGWRPLTFNPEYTEYKVDWRV